MQQLTNDLPVTGYGRHTVDGLRETYSGSNRGSFGLDGTLLDQIAHELGQDSFIITELKQNRELELGRLQAFIITRNHKMPVLFVGANNYHELF